MRKRLRLISVEYQQTTPVQESSKLSMVLRKRFWSVKNRCNQDSTKRDMATKTMAGSTMTATTIRCTRVTIGILTVFPAAVSTAVGSLKESFRGATPIATGITRRGAHALYKLTNKKAWEAPTRLQCTSHFVMV